MPISIAIRRPPAVHTTVLSSLSPPLTAVVLPRRSSSHPSSCATGKVAIAAQTLLDLGYTNIDNLDGGMTAWTADGGDLVQVSR